MKTKQKNKCEIKDTHRNRSLDFDHTQVSKWNFDLLLEVDIP